MPKLSTLRVITGLMEQMSEGTIVASLETEALDLGAQPVAYLGPQLGLKQLNFLRIVAKSLI